MRPKALLVTLAVLAIVFPLGAAHAAALCLGQIPTITGTDAGDVLVGTPLDDVIAAGDDNDTVWGLGGDDVICGGPGSDFLDSPDNLTYETGVIEVLSGGDDLISGGSGDDKIGGAGSDRLYGEEGRDFIKAAIGSVEAHGGPDDDTLVCSYSREGSGSVPSTQLLFGDGGWDDLIGGDNSLVQCVAHGGDEPDWISYFTSDDTVFGDAGPDYIDDVAGVVFAGPGDDVIHAAAAGAWVAGEEGADVATGKSGAVTFYGGEGNDDFFGRGGTHTVFGGEGDDSAGGGPGSVTFFGGEGSDWLYGGLGSDTAFGGGGSDTLQGGPDGDVLYGEAGDDTLVGDHRWGPGTEGPDGDDTLDGGDGIDGYTGDDGFDRCRGEFVIENGSECEATF